MIKEIVAHFQAHADEYVASLALKLRGETKFPGASTAEYHELTETEAKLLREGKTLGDLFDPETTVFLGLGGGPFDEHTPEHDGDCCLTLVAKEIGIMEDIRWEAIIKYIHHTDRNRPNSTLDLEPTTRRLHAQGWDPQSILTYVEMTVVAKLEEQEAFLKTSLKGMEKEEIEIRGEPHPLAILQNADPILPRYLFFLGTSIIVNRTTTGHIQILTRQELNLDLRDIVRLLRITEQKKAKKTNPITDWKELEREMVLPEIPEWYYEVAPGWIMNGSAKRQDIPPTRLTLAEVVYIVKKALSFKCPQGKCFSVHNRCGYYDSGYIVCRRIRAAEFNKNQTSSSQKV